ncbi:hypothetical protein B0H11DRAFT_2237630 [Mycena galericulata]|nr:hypothetical protein B0H11DRAFT_2237630 [Mycena galericulata]
MPRQASPHAGHAAPPTLFYMDFVSSPFQRKHPPPLFLPHAHTKPRQSRVQALATNGLSCLFSRHVDSARADRMYLCEKHAHTPQTERRDRLVSSCACRLRATASPSATGRCICPPGVHTAELRTRAAPGQADSRGAEVYRDLCESRLGGRLRTPL